MADDEKQPAGKPTVILGAMEFGRRCDLAESKKMTMEFLRRGYSEIDTAYMYAGGKSEQMLSQMGLPSQAAVATKANPWNELRLTPAGLQKQLAVSLERMQADSCDLFYLHAPDHKQPILETLRAVQQSYEQGKFKRFGLSNYSSWQVAEIYCLCRQNGWVLPTVYQGMYNPVTRMVERELFPCLRHFGIVFYAYNPLAGGVLTGKHKFEEHEQGTIKEGRFFGKAKWADAYRKRYWRKEVFAGVDAVKAALEAAYPGQKVSLVEATMRWMVHNSKLQAGDAVILGASSYGHFVQNLDALEVAEGLDDRVLAAFDECAQACEADCPCYFR